MKSTLRLVSLFLALIMMLFWCLVSCNTPDSPDAPDAPDTPEKPDDKDSIPTEEYTLPLEDGYNQLTIYFNHNDTYENCDVWIWWGDVAGKGYILHECAYGAKAVVNVPEGVEEVGFIVRKNCSEPGGSSWGSATKDFEADRFAVIEG